MAPDTFLPLLGNFLGKKNETKFCKRVNDVPLNMKKTKFRDRKRKRRKAQLPAVEKKKAVSICGHNKSFINEVENVKV